MKKVIAWLLAIALTAAVSIGATLAYLTDTDEDVNVMTLGKVKIDQLEYERVDVESKDDKAEVQEFHDNKPLLPSVIKDGLDYSKPGDTYVDWEQIGKDGYTSPIWNPELINNEVDKMVFIKNKGDYDAYVRSVFAFEAGKYTTLDEFNKMVHLNLNTTDYTWEWVKTPVAIPNADGSASTNYFIATATYNKVLAPGALTEISLSQIALDKTATNEDVEAFGDTYQVLVKSQGIQADGFDRPDAALNEGFGTIDADNIPWENDSPTRGVSLKKALHYYEGGATKITGSVANVIFGKTADYPEVVNSDSGTIVDVEQDVPARAYYVSNGSTYDVYVLSDSAIYAPANSKNLFASMSSLKTVKGDLDTSRAYTMESMFDYCGALQSVDCADWDTGNVTTMKYMFYGCGSLTELDVADWDVSNAEILNQLFYSCKKLKSVDVSAWDVSNVKDLTYVFGNCYALTNMDLSMWDTRNATTMYGMFYNCTSLTDVNLSNWKIGSKTPVSTGTNLGWMFGGCSRLTNANLTGWDVSHVTKMNNMFYGCSALQSMNMANWDVSNVTTLEGVFASCGNLKTVDMTGWQPASVTTLYSLFYNCTNLQSADVSGWKMPNLTTTSHMFRGCNNMTSVNISDWYTPSLTSMDAMFHTCKELTTIDVSSFDTSKCEEISQVFEHCYKLEEIVGLGNWNTESCRTFEECFSSCYALKVLDMSGFNTRLVEDAFYPMQNGSTGNGFKNMLPNMRSLEKMILSADFSFDGDGKVTTADKKVILPSPAAKEGYIGKWQNVETGVVYDASEIPEETAATYVAYYEYASKGAKMIDALHYLDANTSGTKITKKVTKVVFGLNKDYPDITSAYTGVLADQEQDVPVYAYYVPDGTNYHIYFLADSAIYAPKDCTDLFLEMSALKAVDTTNFDMSRAQILYKMFRLCGALTDIDVSNWNTSNVTSMRAMFSGASSLVSVDTTKWDTSKVVEMNNMFYDCFALTEIKGHENWDTSSATSMVQMFNNCHSLTTLQLGNWDVSHVTRFKAMFGSRNQNKGDMALTKLDIENWDMSSATDLEAMFYGCGQLTSLDLSKWNVENVTTMSHLFADCFKLQSVDFTGWNTASLISMNAMFNHCTSLKTLDMSMFDTSNVEAFPQLFEACSSLESIVGLENWNTTSGHDFNEMFSGCGALKELNLSNFDTRNSDAKHLTEGKYENGVFLRFASGCGSLEKITFGPNFSFDGSGNCPDGYKFVMPSATNVEGWDGKWYTADGTGYLPSEIPEETAATYYAVKPVTP